MVIPTLPPDVVNTIDSASYCYSYRKFLHSYNNISLVNILAQNPIKKCRQYYIKTDYIKQSYIICKKY